MASILIVDDEEPVRQVLRRILEADGHEVFEATNGVEALAVLGEHAIALAFVDLGMPVMDGFELMRRMDEEYPGTKVVTISTEGGVLDLAERQAGTVGCLEKPLEREEVLAAVEHALG